MGAGHRWVRETAELAREADRIGPGPLAVDVEADSFHHYYEKVCLIQLSFGGEDLLLDPLAGCDPAPLARVLGDPAVRKVLHGADYDLRVLQRDFSLALHGVFDTMIASRLVGERAFGLAALLAKYAGVVLDKRHQRADWSVRPLPAELAEYAALDTRHLVALADSLSAALARLGRTEWAEEEFRRLETVRFSEDPARAPSARRIKGAERLDRRQLAVLCELFDLREGIAQKRDVPPFRVIRDEALCEIARACPREPADLRNLPAVPRSFASGERGQALLSAIARAMALPEAELPEREPRRQRPREDPALTARLRRLQHERDRIALELDLDPSVLAPRKLLETLLLAQDSGADPGAVADLRRWQAQFLLPLLAPGVKS